MSLCNIRGNINTFGNVTNPFTNYFQPYSVNSNFNWNIGHQPYFNNWFNINSIFMNQFSNNYYSNYQNYIYPTNNNISYIDNHSNYEEIESKPLVHGARYNKDKGELLAENVIAGLPKNRDPKNPLCAKYVKNAIKGSGLGDYINGNGEYCKYILRANDNFQEVNVLGKDFDSLPKGSIIVYDAGEKCTNSKGDIQKIGKNGHVLIITDKGQGCSDKIENEILKTDRAYTFIPV